MARVASPSSVTSPHLRKPEENPKEVALYDRDVDIHDPIVTTQSMYEAIRLVHNNASISGDHLILFHYHLVKAIVPQTYNFPKLVQWCSKHYFEYKRVVLAKDGHKISCSFSL